MSLLLLIHHQLDHLPSILLLIHPMDYLLSLLLLIHKYLDHLLHQAHQLHHLDLSVRHELLHHQVHTVGQDGVSSSSSSCG